MFNYVVEQEDIDILRQVTRTVYCKVELLNSDLQTVANLEGNVYNDNFSCDGDSTTRRTYNCDIIVTDSSFNIGKDKNIWIDRFVRIHYGLYNQRTGAIRWYVLGTFTFMDMSYTYSSTEKHLSLTCSDMMAKFDGTKGGVMVYNTEADVTFKLLAGQDMEECIVGLLNFAGITNYSVTGLELTETEKYSIPYEIEWSHGTTFVEAWTQIKELYNYWEFFFDEEGTFIWRKIPTGLNEEVILGDDILAPLVVSETLNDSFQNIYNVTEVWGQELDIVDDDRYTTECTGGTDIETDNVFNITLEGVTSMDDIDNFTSFGIKVSGAYAKYININGLEQIPILNSAGDAMADNTYVADKVYVFRYRRTATGTLTGTPYHNFYLMGQYQAHGYYEETDVNVPYSVPNVGYKIPKVIENTKLYSDEVCNSQAQYETYQTTAKQDTISLTMMIIPFIEPTQKFKYTSLNSGETDEWIIKSFSWSTLEGTMTVELYRFLQDYSYVYNNS